jgi:uncharacterized membrane protein (DUF373 family)
MNQLKRTLTAFWNFNTKDEAFLQGLKYVEGFASRLLAFAMVIVVFSLIYEVGWVVYHDIFSPPSYGRLGIRLIELFGLFLNVLIALEILENIIVYLKTHSSAKVMELVVVTALVAVARKLIILDVSRSDTVGKLIGLAVAILALSISYWVIHHLNRQGRNGND